MSFGPSLAGNMKPEMPFLAAGTVAIIGGIRREHGWPHNGLTALIGTIVLVIVASATAGSKIAPLVRAIGLLLLMAAVMAAARPSKKAKSNG